MKNKVVIFIALIGAFTFYSFKNHSQYKAATLDVYSPNWTRLVDQDLRALAPVFGRALNPQELEHMRWVAKSARFLRGNAGLTKKDNPSQFINMTREQVVDYFMSADSFYDSVLAYNLYFLGFSNTFKNGDEYINSIFNFRSALMSAVNTANDGDYFSFLDMYPQSGVIPFSPTSPTALLEYLKDFKDVEAFLKLPPLEQKHKALDHVVERLEGISTAIASGTMTVEDACNIMPSENLLYYYGTLGVSYEFLQTTGYNEANSNFSIHCYSTPFGAAATFTAPKQFAEFYKKIKPVLNEYDASVYKIRSLKDIKRLPAVLAQSNNFFAQSNISSALPNSSTNYNRKRAAYVLSKFFCDDLTPINVEMPTSHTGGAHGSEPSCYACHYKLDPMAGFFRDYGYFFTSFAGQKDITFDDSATVDKANYEKVWAADPSTGLKWNVGYVRSEKNPKLNSYGESMEDLLKIIRGSYEYKRCIVKRLFKYATDDTQVMDAGYIEDISHRFHSQSEVQSAMAIKDLFRTVVLSKTFAQDDRDPQTCYDLDPAAQSTLPCGIRFVVEKNCTQCHDSSMSFSGLDMTTWKEVSPGEFAFHHEDENGNLLSRTDSFNQIIDRITTNDPKLRMPKKMHMDAAHREQLFLWLNKELQK